LSTTDVTCVTETSRQLLHPKAKGKMQKISERTGVSKVIEDFVEVDEAQRETHKMKWTTKSVKENKCDHNSLYKRVGNQLP